MICRKYKHIILLIGISLGLIGCHTQQIKLQKQSLPVADTTVLPSFPAAVLYVLGAQWETDTALQQQMKMDEYIEQRLIDLYPEKAYRGYINRIYEVVNHLAFHTKNNNTIHQPTQHEFSFAHPLKGTGNNISSFYQYLDSVSLEEELFLLELTPSEKSVWDTLQSLVHSEKTLTRESFDTLALSAFEEEDIMVSIMLSYGSRLFYRIIQSKSRAEKLAYYYYGEATNNGRPGDAFKHIYVNVLLRTYIGEWLTHAIMDVFWEWKNPNAPCDRYMDLHNNIIGRETRYADFTATDASCDDSRHWLQWAERVQYFIADSINGDFQIWDKETPSFIVEPAAEKVSELQYIYWDK